MNGARNLGGIIEIHFLTQEIHIGEEDALHLAPDLDHFLDHFLVLALALVLVLVHGLSPDLSPDLEQNTIGIRRREMTDDLCPNRAEEEKNRKSEHHQKEKGEEEEREVEGPDHDHILAPKINPSK